MNAQVLFVAQKIQHCIWNGTDTHLHRGVIGNQFRNMAADLSADLVIALAAHGEFCHRIIDRHNVIEAADVDE